MIFFSLSFHYYHCFHNLLVDCTREAAVHQDGEFENFSTTLLQHCWSFLHSLVTFHKALLQSLLCIHGELKRRWLPRLAANSSCLPPFSIAVWTHDNRSSGDALLYVWSARILIYIYANLNVYIQIFIVRQDLAEYAQILMYIHEF